MKFKKIVKKKNYRYQKLIQQNVTKKVNNFKNGNKLIKIMKKKKKLLLLKKKL